MDSLLSYMTLVQCRAVLLTPSFSDNVRSCACLIPIVNASLSIVPIPLSRPLFATYLLLLPLSPHPTLCAPFSRTRRLSSPSHPGRPSQTLAARTPFSAIHGRRLPSTPCHTRGLERRAALR
ncbi:hypothetical protein DFH94DRAFT_487176 [Russula ochroleuca]|uniref:Uncharacterized protein n=1 Tax=Russula ochroleuca TaxID=152965 RepID=A0A9P5MV33_9AGAM|nr:hypothetical protein DFH94DRAFT_487176 [Russula ochroleuca]